MWQHPGEYADGFGRWFEDHFAFRSRLVRWYGESRLYLLRQSPTQSVVLGRDGWLFYGDDGGAEDFVNERPLTDAERRTWRDSIRTCRDWLAARGIGYVFFIAPDKHVIYPEEFAASARRVSNTSRADDVYAATAGLDVSVDVRPALLQARNRERVYHVTDTHWNARGALVAYQQIIDAVRRANPSVPPAWRREDFEDQTAIVEGQDLAGMIGLRRVMREEDLRLIPRRPRQARVVDPPGAQPDDELGRIVTEIPGSHLPRALVFRDSFASALAPFLSEHFSRTVYLWQNDFDADAVLAERPDVVIQEIVGRHLYAYEPSPELMPK
jgi:hypothetical protein